MKKDIQFIELKRGTLNDFCNEFDYILIDLSSITYGIKNWKSFIYSIYLALSYGICKSNFIFVLDYSKNEHRLVNENRIKFLKELHLNYVLSYDEPAELKAAKLCKEFQEKGMKCIVLSRDYDVLTILPEMLQPIKISEKSWIIRHILKK